MPTSNEPCFDGYVYRSTKDKLPSFVREQFVAYFMARYPQTRKIRISKDDRCRYTARAKYAGKRTFIVRAYSLTNLWRYMQETFAPVWASTPSKYSRTMYPDRDNAGQISILEMTPAEAEIIHIALMRLLNDLPDNEQPTFRRLLMQLEKLISK